MKTGVRVPRKETTTQKRMDEKTRLALPGHMAMLAANIMWGLMAPVSKEALNYFADNGVSPVVLPAFRMAGATVCFWLMSAMSRHERVAKAEMPLILLGGLLSVAFNQNLFICGIAYTSPVDASVVTTMLPIITMLLAAAILGEPITGLKAGGVATGTAGAILLVMSNGDGLTFDKSHALGDAMCLGAQLSFALYLVLCKRVMSKYSPVTLMKWMFLSATVVTMPFSGPSMTDISWGEVPMAVWGEVAYVVFIGTVMTFFLVPIGQRLLRPTVVSSYNYIQPVVSAAVSLMLGLATFGWVKGAAVALVFSGVLMVSRSRAKSDSIKTKE